MSAEQLALRNLVYAAWSEAHNAHQAVVAVSNKNLLLKLEEHGDDLVAASMSLALWDCAVDFGSGTGDWDRAVQLMQATATSLGATRRPAGVVGGAVWQVRQLTIQAVLTRADEILATYAS